MMMTDKKGNFFLKQWTTNCHECIAQIIYSVLNKKYSETKKLNHENWLQVGNSYFTAIATIALYRDVAECEESTVYPPTGL